jgi:hypothetical protein
MFLVSLCIDVFVDVVVVTSLDLVILCVMLSVLWVSNEDMLVGRTDFPC